MQKKILTYFLFLIFTISGYAAIPTSSLEPIQQELNQSNKETLLLLDVGGTLLSPTDAVLHPVHETWRKDWFQRHYPNLSRVETLQCIRIVEDSPTNKCLLDLGWPQLIADTQKKGIRVIALTKYPIDPTLKGMRNAKLNFFGIVLKNDLPELISGSSFAYSDGVIETEAKFKGPILKEVLQQLKKVPSKIIFVDDRLEQCESVEKTCSEARIPCVAFHYQAVILNPPKLDPEIADYQLRTLINEHRWISDKDAQSALETQEKL